MDVLNEVKKLMKGHRGNPNLKRAGQEVEFTHDNVAEYIKCKTDPLYFVNAYCKIISVDDGLIDFKTFPYQNKALDAMAANRKVIMMFPRQMGKTTVVAAHLVHNLLFADNIPNIAIVANKASAAREVMQRMQMIYEYIPKWMQKGVKTWNKGNIILEGEDGADGAQAFTAATTISGPRGKSVTTLYIDECAIIPNSVADEFFTATFPIISGGLTTKVIMTSTPKGYNHFWKFWKDAESGANGYVPILANWREHPGRDDKWADEQLRELGPLKYTQEVECAFLGSSATLLTPECLRAMNVKPFIANKDGFDIQEMPLPEHSYTITVDPSKGVGNDYSTFTVVDTTNLPYYVVAKYRDNLISPMVFPNVIVRVAEQYNEAFILVEDNVSEQVPYIIYNEIGYENLLTVSRGKKGQYISAGFGNVKLGLTMDKRTKIQGCQHLKILLEERKLIVSDPDIINELMVFIDNGRGSYAADDTYHDDLVMSLVIFAWLSNQEFFKDLNNIDLRAKIYADRMAAIDEQMLPPGFFVDGNEEEADFRELFRI